LTRGRVAWAAFAALAGALAAITISRWLWALTLDGPVLYGEGAVAHAALLARDRVEYYVGAAVDGGPLRPIFTAANYPPLYFHVAGLGDPFVAGRIASIAATLLVATTIAWRARRAGPLVAIALAAAWIASFPVAVWGPAIKPDLVALALTVGGVLALASAPRRAVLGGVLLALAVATKPTAALPALALAGWLVRADRAAFARYLAGGLVGAVAALVAFPELGPFKLVVLHVVTWNGLPWSAEQALALLLVGVLTLGVPIGVAALARAPRGPIAAYAIGALGIVALGGREGATINYLLDLSAAAALALAGVATRLRASSVFPLAAAAQLVVGIALFDPFGTADLFRPLPSAEQLGKRAPTTGAWGDPARIAVVRRLPAGAALVEDSGLLLAVGREPVVDDVFLWSRLLATGISFAEGDLVIRSVADARYSSIVSEADLERLDDAPAYERQRWHPRLVAAILERYRLDRVDAGLRVYVPKNR